jgi:hypothetical protein
MFTARNTGMIVRRSGLPATGRVEVSHDVPDLWVTEPLRSVVIQVRLLLRHFVLQPPKEKGLQQEERLSAEPCWKSVLCLCGHGACPAGVAQCLSACAASLRCRPAVCLTSAASALCDS